LFATLFPVRIAQAGGLSLMGVQNVFFGYGFHF
jgi:hypothetical protein